MPPDSCMPDGPAHDVERVRADFPVLAREVHGRPLVYLDSAASAQKPQSVIDAVNRCYAEEYANVHRGLHYLSEALTDRFEAARRRVAAFINAPEEREVIFTRGATEGINLVASGFGRAFLKAGDEIVLTEMEHHSNIVPWQLLETERGVRIRVAPVADDGSLSAEAVADCLTARTKLVAVTHVSNTLGTVVPVGDIIAKAHAAGVPVLVDGCQAAPHQEIDVQALGADFYTFSGHKVYGPSGVGVLYGRAEYLEAMPPYHGGGEMIREVSFRGTTFASIPHKFEAGTPPIAQVIGLHPALDYVAALGLDTIAAHERRLLARATAALDAMAGVTIIGRAPEKAGILSFVVDGAHASDIGTLVDKLGVAIRTGHHCTQPLMERFGVPATARASFGLYNNDTDVDRFTEAVDRVRRMFG